LNSPAIQRIIDKTDKAITEVVFAADWHLPTRKRKYESPNSIRRIASRLKADAHEAIDIKGGFESHYHTISGYHSQAR
jgi:hypothetical protein